MTQPDLQARLLARVDEEIKYAEDFIENEPSPIRCANASISLLLYRALRVALMAHEPILQNPMIGVFYNTGTIWVCKSCFEPNEDGNACSVAFPCPELTEIAKEMGI